MATFGYTTQGAQGGSASNNQLLALIATSPNDMGTVIDFNAYLRKNVNNSVVKGAIWLASDGTLVANSVTSPFTLTSTSYSLFTFTYITPPVLSPNTSYHLGIIAGDTNSPIVAEDSGTNLGSFSNNNYTTPTNETSPTTENFKRSIYVNYTAAATTSTSTTSTSTSSSTSTSTTSTSSSTSTSTTSTSTSKSTSTSTTSTSSSTSTSTSTTSTSSSTSSSTSTTSTSTSSSTTQSITTSTSSSTTQTIPYGFIVGKLKQKKVSEMGEVVNFKIEKIGN